MTALAQASAGWQAGFLQLLPAVQTHAKIQFRRLPPERREDAIQEAIAAACVSYQLAAAQGKLAQVHPGSLADHAVRHARTGRHVGGSQDAARDALSAAAQRRHRFAASSLDLRDDEAGEWHQVAVEDKRVAVADLAAFRIDFARWLRTLSRRDRKVVAALTRGDRTHAVAGRFGISPGRVSQLRRKYERLWLAFQGEAAGQTVA